MNRTPMIDSLLIANRGEIAVRIIRTARKMGIRTVAVYSEADRHALHVKMADDAVHIGPAPANESYLQIERIIEAAEQAGATAVHPGYGFLSENPDFSLACSEAGLVFVGPTAASIRAMADKAEAKRRMLEIGIPCIPGYQGEEQSDEKLLQEAESIGYPIMVKAAAGGGGRGMRVVRSSDELPSALSIARSEAATAFGDSRLILERAIERPRHVEIQVFCDQHGNSVYLGERDCSIQRRHQKILEEAPCPALTTQLRRQMGEAGVKVARSIEYHGAGTVEFLLADDGTFYFLEMNTRLQVEHPVTEMTTGLDLVELQIRTARGEQLGLDQDDIRIRGHAIEARLCAEDPQNDFLPTAGPVFAWTPAEVPGLRFDSGIETGGQVSRYYDSMVAKIIAHGASRAEAIAKLKKALIDTVFFGPQSNREFLLDCLSHETFGRGEATTAFVAEEAPALLEIRAVEPPLTLALAALSYFYSTRQAGETACLNPADELLNWTSAATIPVPYRLKPAACEDPADVYLYPLSTRNYRVQCPDQSFDVEVTQSGIGSLALMVDNSIVNTRYVLDVVSATIMISFDGRDYRFVNQFALPPASTETVGAGSILAPMHGVLAELFTSVDAAVKKGEKIAVLEAMKMQHELRSDIDGIVKSISFAPGDQVDANALLIQIEQR